MGVGPHAVRDSHAAGSMLKNAFAGLQTVQGIKLYKYVVAGQQGQWQLLSANAQPEFIDGNEDNGKKKAEWFLVIDSGDIEVRADGSLKYDSSTKDKRITFHAAGFIWAMRFPSEEVTRTFIHELDDKIFFNTFGVENDSQGRTKALGGDFADIFFNCEQTTVEPMEVEPEPEAGPEAEQGEGEDYEEQEFDKQGTPVRGIVMGATDNSYIMRGNQFDVLKNRVGGVEDAGISFNVTPAKQGTPQFTPSKVLMTNGERNMNILTPDDRNKLFRANIEYQRVVGEFSFMKDGAEIPIDDIVHENKHGQLDDGSTFLGLAANRLCRWDLRDPTGVVQQSPVVNYEGGKDFARGTNFTCMATSGDGYVVVGSKDGKVRLYSNKSLNKAQTSIPGLGAPITAVDVTYDGKWVVATTDDYLLVIKTIFINKAGKETNGFKAPMGKEIPLPRLLRLRPEDVIRTSELLLLLLLISVCLMQ